MPISAFSENRIPYTGTFQLYNFGEICYNGKKKCILCAKCAETAEAFIIFGRLIYFGKKYHLINGFSEDFKVRRRDESYARRIWFAELTERNAVFTAWNDFNFGVTVLKNHAV